MKKKFWKYGVLIILLLSLVLSACGKNEEAVNSDTIEVVVEDEVEVVDSKEIEEEKIREGVPSPTSGLYVDEPLINRRPFAVMLDNHSNARPQAGLDQAEIVYEILAEGGITRYMAIFLVNEPETIGPVRSARPYYIDKSLEYNALYVHVGGSPQAFDDIKALKVADIDAMSRDGSIFWRKKHKSMPHNMYTSTEAIRKAASQSKYLEDVEFETLKYNEDIEKIDGEVLSTLEIPYYSDYTVSFRYNDDENKYMRYINDTPHLDEISEEHLNATNIIIQEAKSKVIDSELRLDIDLVGQGSGLFITNGEVRKIKWEKESRRDITRFYYEDATPISLNPGVTWIQVIPDDVKVITN